MARQLSPRAASLCLAFLLIIAVAVVTLVCAQLSGGGQRVATDAYGRLAYNRAFDQGIAHARPACMADCA